MVKTRNSGDGNGISASKATWDDDLTLTFCELCVKEVDAGNRPTTHLNSKGWESVVALFEAKTQKNYGKSHLKNRWDTLKKEWRLWTKLLKNTTDLRWCPIKRTVDATTDWWAGKIQENPDFKRFKKRGIEPRLNELMGHMFGDIVANGEHAWAPSSGVLPGGASKEDVTPDEGFGDSDEHKTENEGIPNNEVAINVQPETSSKGKRVLGVVQDKGKKLTPIRRFGGKTLTTPTEKLCDSVTIQRKPVDGIVSSSSQYTISDAMDALRALENEIPKKHALYFFATKIFQVPVKREMFLNLDPDVRTWWLQCEYDEQNANTCSSSLLAASPHGFQQTQLFRSRSK